MTLYLDIPPSHLAWALDRSGRPQEEVSKALPMLDAWLSGERKPTLRQLKAFANKTYTPFGLFFLDELPEDELPIADFRRVRGKARARPSVHLLDTLHLCQQRQAWYEDYAALYGEPARPFVGSASIGDPAEAVAQAVADTLDFGVHDRSGCKSWEEAFGCFVTKAENAGVLVMVSGVVGQNTHRPLDVEEFRGFALTSTHAPLVFINGADAPAAQMFTLAHELAHLWLGSSAVSSGGVPTQDDPAVERWCNQVAAEMLVPRDALLDQLTGLPLDPASALPTARRLTRVFKVSPIVMLLRFLACDLLDRNTVNHLVGEEVRRIRAERNQKGGGGRFYHTQARRVSRRLIQAMAVCTWEGNAPFTDAFRLLGVKGTEGFKRLCEVAGGAS